MKPGLPWFGCAAVLIDLGADPALNSVRNEPFFKVQNMSEHSPGVSQQFSHVVIFWTDPANPRGAEELVAGAEQYLKPIPGVLNFHVGKMVPSHRPVVEQSYQVALNIIFPDKATQDAYQTHPLHIEFVEKVFKKVCTKVVVYDFA